MSFNLSYAYISHLTYVQIFVRELRNLLIGATLVFLGCEIPIRILSDFGGKAGVSLTLFVVGSVICYLFIEDNEIWNNRTWAHLSSYFIIIVLCHIVMVFVGDSFLEQVTEFTDEGLLPVTHIRLKDADSWSMLKWTSFHLFEWFLTFYFLVAVLTTFKIFYLICLCIFTNE